LWYAAIMRIASILFFSSLSMIACKVEVGTTANATEGGESSGGEESTSDDPTTGGGGGACVPGASKACTCTNGSMGAQVCAADGNSYGECTCEDGSGGTVSSSQGMTTSSTDPTTAGETTTTGEPETTTDATTEPVGSTGGGSTGEPVECVDSGEEPNEEEMDAIDLGDIGCMDDPESFMGVLSGDADVDWYQYHGVWGFNCGDVDPSPLHTLTASDNVRMCVFAECDMSMATFECQNGAEAAMSPEGLPGCCDSGDVTFLLNCAMNANESAQMFVRLDQGPADGCVDYSVEYSYQPAN
jgi:hypothetical protein